MSTTPNDVRKPAIIAAQTNNDVLRAIADDPNLRNAVVGAFGAILTGDKALFGTKTFWMAIFTPIVGALAARYLGGADPGTVGTVATVLTSAAMIGMRLVTKAPVTGVVTPASAS